MDLRDNESLDYLEVYLLKTILSSSSHTPKSFLEEFNQQHPILIRRRKLFYLLKSLKQKGKLDRHYSTHLTELDQQLLDFYCPINTPINYPIVFDLKEPHRSYAISKNHWMLKKSAYYASPPVNFIEYPKDYLNDKYLKLIEKCQPVFCTTPTLQNSAQLSSILEFSRQLQDFSQKVILPISDLSLLSLIPSSFIPGVTLSSPQQIHSLRDKNVFLYPTNILSLIVAIHSSLQISGLDITSFLRPDQYLLLNQHYKLEYSILPLVERMRITIDNLSQLIQQTQTRSFHGLTLRIRE